MALAATKGEKKIKVSVLYPSGEGKTFDIAYNCDKHIPMVRRLLGPALKGVAVEQGIAGGEPGAPAPYLAMGHLSCDSIEAFMTAFLPVADVLHGDIPNYTNSRPTIQASEVKL
jgi:uncharacterized protein (TIGR02118 family)